MRTRNGVMRENQENFLKEFYFKKKNIQNRPNESYNVQFFFDFK